MNKHPLVQLLDTIQGPCPVARSLESELVVLAVESELIASLPKRGWGRSGLNGAMGIWLGYWVPIIPLWFMVGDPFMDPIWLGFFLGMNNAIFWGLWWIWVQTLEHMASIWHHIPSQSDVSIGKCWSTDQPKDLGAKPPSHLGILPLHQESLCHDRRSTSTNWPLESIWRINDTKFPAKCQNHPCVKPPPLISINHYHHFCGWDK